MFIKVRKCSALFTILAAGMTCWGAEIDLAGMWRLTGSDEKGAAIACPIAVPGDVQITVCSSTTSARVSGLV